MTNREAMKPIFYELLDKINNGNIRNGTAEIRCANVIFTPTEEYLDYGKVRPASRKYIEQEMAWYLSQDLYILDWPGIRDNKIWQQCATNKGHVNSNYGYCVFNCNNGPDQMSQALTALTQDKYSRRSVMYYTGPDNYAKSRDGIHANNDMICTTYTQHFIENDNTFTYIVNMRSNDIIYGLQNDYSWHRYIYWRLFSALKVFYPETKVGKIIWQANSLHVYEKHFDLIKQIIKEYEDDEL